VPEGAGPEAELSRLVLDPGCFDDLHWRCDLPSGVSFGSLEEALVAAGYASRSLHPHLKVFRHRDEHEIAIVTSTGRVQLRLYYGVEISRRSALAEDLYQDLRRCLNGAPRVAE